MNIKGCSIAVDLVTGTRGNSPAAEREEKRDFSLCISGLGTEVQANMKQSHFQRNNQQQS